MAGRKTRRGYLDGTRTLLTFLATSLCFLSFTLDFRTGKSRQGRKRWDEKTIVSHLEKYPQRAHFADLFREGGFRSGMEVGLADGRFSEHFLRLCNDIPIIWHMVEPFPNVELMERFTIREDGTANFNSGAWFISGIGKRAYLIFHKELSTEARLLHGIGEESLDFIYLDGAHDYENVKLELPLYFKKVRPGGVLAGHDYCNHGEVALDCLGCSPIPRCGLYTEYGEAHGKHAGLVGNQQGVVRAVQEWLQESQPKLRLHHTAEDFTRTSLTHAGMDYDLVITNTRNPSWFVVKPARG